jgi:RHS repeat-associated protein
LLILSVLLLPRDALSAPKEERPVDDTPEKEAKPAVPAEPVVRPAAAKDGIASKVQLRGDKPELAVKEKDQVQVQPQTKTTKSLPTGENKTGVSAQSISVPKGPGTIEGMGESFSAQASTGIATFTVPFAIPAARGDAQASLGLSYSSANGSGVAGVGWSVGVPFIARQTDRGLPRFDDEDRFVYNGGQELVPVLAVLPGEQLPVWADGWQYFRPRVEGSYLRFFWDGAKLWRVQDKSGVVLELGEVGAETDALEVDPNDASHVFRWNLKRQLDAHGNEVRYYYDLHDGGLSYLTDIFHTQPPGAQAPIVRDAWAYQVHLSYEPREDDASSFRRGWETVERYRLTAVEISGKESAASGARREVRKYTLSYTGASHMSLLDSVRVAGRCSEAQPGERCTLPAMRLGYTHVETTSSGAGVFVDGFEVIDTQVRSLTNSPKHSVDEDYTDLYDVNADGLPDVVTMMPGLYGGKHGLWIQGKGGRTDWFGAQEPMGVLGVLGGSPSVISKHNANLASLDVDGDAIIDLLHMPKVKTYSVYSPEYRSGEWKWVGREVTTADNLDARIDLGNDADELRVFDVDGDGLVDVVKTAGTALEVWFALGRYPGGDGLFGSAYWTGPETAQLSMAPVMRCVPHSSTPVRFSDPDIKLADMNGDGLTDIVRVRKGDIRYWPGRGDGTFGTGPLGCAGGTFSTGSYVQMADSPWYTDPDDSGLRFNDVNGDGTADLVQIRFQDVDVWYNVDGRGWQDRRILDDTPASPSYQQRVRLVDVNGSGTPDILWGDGLAYKYIDLQGGTRPWLLNRVENGLGKTTEVEYTTSVEHMLAAEKAGNGWDKKCPTVLHMVERVTVLDGLAAVGRPGGEYVTEYEYRDPYFDGLQREFRGFSSTIVRTVGDANSPTSESRTEFLLGESPYTAKSDRWRDNPNESLKGLPTVSETYDPASSVYLSTSATTYALRKLYEGADGRGVYVAFAKQTDNWLYDTAAFVPGSPAAFPVEARGPPQTGDQVVAPTVQLRSNASVHTASDVVVDNFGNRLSQTAYGQVGIDEAITQHTAPSLVATPSHVLGEGHWSFRTAESWVQGSDPTKRSWSRTFYNEHGDPIRSEVYVSGSQPLMWEDASVAPIAPLADGWQVTARTAYDAAGNPVLTWAAGNRCSAVQYDDDYLQLPMVERVHLGDVQPLTVEGQTFACGEDHLSALASYDRGLQAVRTVLDVNLGMTQVDYDPLGRMKAMWAPHPHGPGLSAQPSLMVEYHLPDTTNRPVSMLVSRTQDGADHDVAAYHESYAFVDGLGRTVATLSEADLTDDGFSWVVEGLTDYDAKGAARRKYLAWSYDGEPEAYDLSVASPSKYGQQRYDAFGRAIQTQGLDGTVTLLTRYHALSADAWDAEDLGPGPHQGTYASERKDGHGRVVETTERVKENGSIQARHVRLQYLPTGQPTSITRHAGATSVGRTMQYDSLGRMVLNLEPNLGANGWRYLFDAAGDLVATSDPRECGVRFGYDTAGRLVSEDYVPCEAHHAPYSASPEVTYEYDDPASDALEAFSQPAAGQDCRTANHTRGRLVAVTDRAQRSLTCYDGRGRTVEVAKRLANPGGVIDGRWYNRRASYDGADRPTHETTGATGGPSQVDTTYTARGKVKHVDSSYGLLVDHVRRDADGLVTEIQYGDAASTTTAFTYDDLRRLRNLTTYRASLDGWVHGPGTQQMLLQDEQFTYDRVGNPLEIRDWRDPAEWPVGAKPVTRKMQYDSLYRLSRMDYQYSAGDDAWVDPYGAEAQDPSRSQPSPRADFAGGKRVQWQSFRYDWLGNTELTDDDAQAFYDRSLGEVKNVGYKLQGADIDAGDRQGELGTVYDAAGNLVQLDVDRHGDMVGGAHWPPSVHGQERLVQRYAYEWDEVGRLVRARRWDMQNPTTIPPDDADVDAELSFTYDASDQRVRKTSGAQHTLYVFASLELRGAQYEAGDYSRTEVPYLFANGVRLARVVHGDSTGVYLELGDHLGSTSVVLDHATGELVQRDTAYAYGAAESSYRPEKFEEFREDYRFTGKEDDVEVGLIYFGRRFYAPLLQRWISADPLAVHAPGEADLNLYAYVHGKVLVAVDPVGLEPGVDESSADAPMSEPSPDTLPESWVSSAPVPSRADPPPAPVSDSRFSSYQDTGQLTSSPSPQPESDEPRPPRTDFWGALGQGDLSVLDRLKRPEVGESIAPTPIPIPPAMAQLPDGQRMAILDMTEGEYNDYRATVEANERDNPSPILGIVPLPPFTGRTSGVIVPTKPPGPPVPLTSGARTGARFPYSQADGHVETLGASWMKENGVTEATVYHNHPGGTCPNCNRYLPTFLEEGSTMTVVPPENALPKTPSWVGVPKTYTGNSGSPY